MRCRIFFLLGIFGMILFSPAGFSACLQEGSPCNPSGDEAPCSAACVCAESGQEGVFTVQCLDQETPAEVNLPPKAVIENQSEKPARVVDSVKQIEKVKSAEQAARAAQVYRPR